MEPNQHWTNLFKRKPSTSHNQARSSANDETNRAEPKARWKPRPEQIRILKSIFNSGMVNPSRNEINGIRAQLEEFGQVRDVNVFYWFRNRRFRSKQAQRHLQPSANDINEGTGENIIEGQSIVVFVNNKLLQVSVGPINVRAVFGENAVLFHTIGQRVLVNELGFTLEGLQRGAGYYAVALIPMQKLVLP